MGTDNNKPKVSVIMGVYNCEATIAESIESILQQTFKDWELIAIDDGSSDKSLLILERYSKQYPNIIVQKNASNMGLNKTLNKCLGLSRGTYIARMDGDDISLPERLQKEVDFLDSKREYDIVSTQMIHFDEHGEYGKSNRIGEPEVTQLAKGSPFAHAAAMVRKSAFDKVGGYSTEKQFLRVEDWNLWVKMYSVGSKGYNLEEALYKMRDDRNATRRRKFKYRINEMNMCIFAVHKLNLPKYYYIFALRPIMVGLLPIRLYERLHKKRMSSF